MIQYCYSLLHGVTPAVIPCEEICPRCLRQQSAYDDRPCYDCWRRDYNRETGEPGGASSPEAYEADDARLYPSGTSIGEPPNRRLMAINDRTDAHWRRYKHE
jgi:hypothetical protein